MKGISHWLGSIWGNNIIPEQWAPQQIKSVKLRSATVEEIAQYRKEHVEESWLKSIPGFLSNIVERTLSTIHLIATRNIKSNFERAENKDPFLSPYRNWILADTLLIRHPSVISEVIKYHRHDSNGFFEIKSQERTEKMIQELFNDSSIHLSDILFLCTPPEETRKYHNFFAKFFAKNQLHKKLFSIESCIDKTLEGWAGQKQINLTHETKLLSCKIMAIHFLGAPEYAEEIVNSLDTFSAFLSAKFQHKDFDSHRLNRARANFKCIAEKVIEKAKQDPESSTVVSTMLKEGSFSEREIYLTLFSLFTAGVENAAAAMTFTILKCAQDSNLQENIRNECLSALQNHNAKNFHEVLEQLPLVQQTLASSLRQFPPVYKVTRITTCPLTLEVKNKSDEIVQRYIPANTRLDLMMSSAAKCAELSQDHLSESASLTSLPWLPFGRGAHRCPGASLFETEAKLLLASLCRDYHITTQNCGEPNQIGTAFNRLDRDVMIQLTNRK